MVYDITDHVEDICTYVSFRKKCISNYIITSCNYKIPPQIKYVPNVVKTKIQSDAMIFLQIPLNLIEDAIAGNFDISIEELATSMNKLCPRSAITRYGVLIHKLFNLFPEGIVIKRDNRVALCADNAVLWAPDWISECIDTPTSKKKTSKKYKSE